MPVVPTVVVLWSYAYWCWVDLGVFVAPRIDRPTFPQYFAGNWCQSIAKGRKWRAKSSRGKAPNAALFEQSPKFVNLVPLLVPGSRKLGARSPGGALSPVPGARAAAIMTVALLCLQCSVNASFWCAIDLAAVTIVFVVEWPDICPLTLPFPHKNYHRRHRGKVIRLRCRFNDWVKGLELGLGY